MKRILYYVLIVLTCLFCLTACNNNGQESSSSEKVQNTIEFVENEISLSVGESVQAEVVTSQSNVFLLWSVRDGDIASVSTKGVITALQEGQTICYARYGNELAMCLIKVTAKSANPLLSVSVPYNVDDITLYVGDALDLRAIVKLGDSVVENAQVEYVVGTAEVLSVEDGKVVGVKAGSDTVTVRATYGEQTAMLVLTISVVEA